MPSSDPVTKARLVTTPFVLVFGATLAYFISVGMLLPSLPRYVEGPLGGSDFAVGVAVGAFGATAVLVRPFAGRLGDRRGRRVLLVAGGAIVAATVGLIVPTTNLAALIVLRLVMGMGEAAYFVGAVSVVNDLAPEHRRGEALSYFSLALFTGLAVGPLLAEWLSKDGTTFDAVWFVSAGFAAVAGLVGLAVPDTRSESAPSSRGPILHRAGLLPGAVLFTSIWGLAGYNAFVPLYGPRVGMSGVGIVFALYSAVVLPVRSFGARLPDRVGPSRVVAAALVCSAIGFVLLGTWASPAGLLVATVFVALGHSLTFPALMTIAVRGANAAERASVVGTFTAFVDLSFGLGATTAGGIASAIGMRGMFVSSAGMSLVGLTIMMVRRSEFRARGGVTEPVPAPEYG